MNKYFSKEDQAVILKRGLSMEKVLQQLQKLKEGTPPIHVARACTINDGIQVLDEVERHAKHYEQWAATAQVVKFVPASGAASRLFQPWYNLYNGLLKAQPTKSQEHEANLLMHMLPRLPFYTLLCELLACKGYLLDKLIAQKAYTLILENILFKEGLGLGVLPKALIPFHVYKNNVRTALEEHLVEGAYYATSKGGIVYIHFTILVEHNQAVEALIRRVKAVYEKALQVKYAITLSYQAAYTDTIVANAGVPCRTKTGELLFHPGGHGTLLDDLNSLSVDLIFIKNIDNVATDALVKPISLYQKALAGYLLQVRETIFQYLRVLPQLHRKEQLDPAIAFLNDVLCCPLPEAVLLGDLSLLKITVFNKLNRPIRVCGMVKNKGREGGGPFWVKQADGSLALQIVENTQLELTEKRQKQIFQSATHFNPVNIVCCTKDYQGRKFDLRQFKAEQAGLVTYKSIGGKKVQVLEYPGLWNGSMYNWNTIFVEVPLMTFNPVKEITDLYEYPHTPEVMVD